MHQSNSTKLKMYVPDPMHLYQIWNLGYANAGPVAYMRTYLPPRRGGAQWWFGTTEPCNAVNWLYSRDWSIPVDQSGVHVIYSDQRKLAEE